MHPLFGCVLWVFGQHRQHRHGLDLNSAVSRGTRFLFNSNMQLTKISPPFRICISLRISSLIKGTGARPDYLVNRADQKDEGPLGKKFARKSRNSRRMSGGGIGA